MCDICVMNSVKNRMISRRSFFKNVAVAGAVASVGSSMLAPAAMADGHKGIEDMTHTLDIMIPGKC